MALIDPGKEYREFRSTLKKPADELSIKNTYRETGLDKRLGDWRGTSQQYQALLNKEKSDQQIQEIGRKTQAIKTMLGQAGSIAKAGFSIDKLDIAPTKEYAEAYPDLSQQKEGQLRFNPETGSVEKLSNKEWLKEIAPELAKPVSDKQPEPTTPKEVITTTPDVINSVQLSDVDIGNIIAGLESGEVGSPETLIDKEKAKLLTDAEKSKASQALTEFQQTMAKSGMAFSGIRTSGEAKIAAESLANQSGIALDLAEKIVNAARTEQTNRIKAIQDSQKIQRDALADMGYVLFNGQLYKTTERERLEKGETGTPTSFKEFELSQQDPEFKKFLEERKGNDMLDMIRTLTLKQMESEYRPSQGQLYYKNTGKVATDLPATFVERVNVLKYFSDQANSLVPRIEYILSQPDVDISALTGALKQFGYQGWGKYLGLSATATDNEKSLFDLMSQLNNEYLYARSGAQINEKESARLGKTMPQAGLTNEENKNRLNNFATTVSDIIKGRLDSYGVGFYGENNSSNTGEDFEEDWKLYQSLKGE